MSSFEMNDLPDGRYRRIPEPPTSGGHTSFHLDEDDTSSHGHDNDTSYHGHGNGPESGPITSIDHSPAHTHPVWPGFVWLMITFIVNALIIVVVRSYQLKGNISKNQKHVFNTLSTGLILILGLNFLRRQHRM